jgi:predicted RNase H-like HicB family nuclease
MNNYGFSVRWSDEDAAYIAACPEFPGVSAFGDTPADALREIQVALELAVETYQEEGWALPAPQPLPQYSGQFRLRVPRSLHGRLADRAEVEGVSLNTLAVSYLAAGLGGAPSPGPAEAHGSPELREQAPRRRRNVA